MKITVKSIGVSKISAIKLIRKYSGFSLKDANDFINNLPDSFMTRTPYDKMDEMYSEFIEEGCIVDIETGYTKPNVPGKKRLDKVVFGTKTENTEKKQLTSKEEITTFLKQRQNLKKGYSGGVVSAIAIIFMFGGFFIFNENLLAWNVYAWTSNVIIGLTIGYSIKRKGKAIDPKAGKFAVSLTIITAIFIRYLYDFIMIAKFGSIFDFVIRFEYIYNIRFIISLVVAALFSYSIAFDRISKIKMNKLRDASKVSNLVETEIEKKRKEYMPRTSKRKARKKSGQDDNVIPDDPSPKPKSKY